jgi:hypothetical protein
MSDSSLKLEHIQKETDIEKDVPISPPDIVETEKIPFLSLKTADLWRNKLYTVVPPKHDLTTGILPEDQQFSHKYVFLWDDYSSLNAFSDSRWKKVIVYLPENIKESHQFVKMVSDVYALPAIPNTWRIEEQPTPPQYVQ